MSELHPTVLAKQKSAEIKNSDGFVLTMVKQPVQSIPGLYSIELIKEITDTAETSSSTYFLTAEEIQTLAYCLVQ